MYRKSNNAAPVNHDAPATWEQLLIDAVNVPGKVAECYRLFHNYSIGNQMLALFQCASRGIEPGPISTYNAWAAKNRQVKKGEKAIILCQPVTFEDKANSTPDNKKMVTIFKYYARWFVLSQTEGEELAFEPIPGWDKDTALRNLGITEESFTMMDGNTQGYAKPNSKTLAINPVAQHPTRTMIHEMAHCILHSASDLIVDGNALDRSLMEVEAESVALIVSDALGLEGQDESRGYIQNWFTGSSEFVVYGDETSARIPDSNARRIFTAADKILKAGTGSQGAPTDA